MKEATGPYDVVTLSVGSYQIYPSTHYRGHCLYFLLQVIVLLAILSLFNSNNILAVGWSSLQYDAGVIEEITKEITNQTAPIVIINNNHNNKQFSNTEL